MSDIEDGNFDGRVIDREGFEEFYPRMWKKISKNKRRLLKNSYRAKHRSGKGKRNETGRLVDSRSPSKSDRGSPVRVKSESRSSSPSSSRAAKHSESRSRSKSRSHSRRHSNRRYSRSRSPSNRKKSRSYSPEYRKKKSQSTSPNRRHPSSRSHDFRKETFSQGAGGGGGEDARANPNPNQCLGVFGLSLYTTEKDLREVFGRYGPLAGVNVVYDQRTGRSRGFAFVYFERIADSKEAMERANGMELDGRHIRVDFSITKRAHTPTPGIYMGRPTHNGGGGERSSSSGGGRRGRDSYDRYDDRRGGGYDRGYDRGDRGYDRYDEYDKYSRRRSPSPYYSRYRSRSRSRSYSPRRY